MNPSLEELACLYTLDRLDERERAAFAARLAHDRELAALVRELEDALARRVRALPQFEPPAGLLARIEARFDRHPAGDAADGSREVTWPWRRVAIWGLAAVVAIAAGTVAVRILRAPGPGGRPVLLFVGLDPGRSTLTELTMRDRPRTADARFIELAELAERYWDKPGDLPGKPGEPGRTERGYALFDPGSNEGFIAIRELPPVEQDKRYQLWVIDTATGRAREAGFLPRGGSGRGLYFFSVDEVGESKPARLAFVITAEDAAAPDSSVPRGKVVLGAKPI